MTRLAAAAAAAPLARTRACPPPVLLVAALWVCAAPAQAQAQTPATPPPAVVVEVVATENVSRSDQFVGRVVAIQSVNLVSRVEGFLEALNFKEGADVNAGDLLVEIEKAPYAAQLAAAKAQLAAAQARVSGASASLKNAQVVLDRQATLVRRGTVSQATFDDAQSARDVAAADVEQANAAVKQAEAQVQTAELNLSYTDIAAPIRGQIGAVAITVGNLVSASSGTIATINQLDPIRVAFSIPEPLYVAFAQQRGGPAETAAARDLFTPELTLPNGDTYGEVGKISFTGNEISPSTGTLVVYADFPNPTEILLPGSFVAVTVKEAQDRPMPVVPASAVLQDREGRYVFLVDADNRAQVRRIDTGPQFETGFAVTQGLAGGETVIVEGLQKVRPGLAVAPTTATTMPPPGALPAAPAAASSGTPQ